MSGPKATPLGAERLRNACLGTLRGLGKSVRAEIGVREKSQRDDGVAPRLATRLTPWLQLKFGTNAAPIGFELRTTGTYLSYALAARFIDESTRAAGHWLLFAPYVPTSLGHHLAAQGVSYVDTAGNCHIETEGLLVAHVEGKKAVRSSDARMPQATNYQLLFALLAQPALVEAPARRVALAAGIGKSAAFEQLGRLNMQGLLDYEPGTDLGLRSHQELLDRWLAAYASSVRRSWLFGTYQSSITETFALEARIERVYENQVWALGGTAAASRMLSLERGTVTVVHFAEEPKNLLERLKAVAAPNGPLVILHTPGTLAYQGVQPRLAHPLLVYSELLSCADSSALQAASVLREQFLAPYFDDERDDGEV